MGAMKRLVDDRADAGLCVLCGEPGPDVPFMSGDAHAECEAVWRTDFADWQRQQAEEYYAQAAAHLDEMRNAGER